VKLTTTEPFPATADTPVGPPGTVIGVTDAELLAVPFPALLIARTWIVYAVPLVSPVAAAVTVVTRFALTTDVEDDVEAVVQDPPLTAPDNW